MAELGREEDPSLAADRRDNELPRLRKSQTVNADPSLQYDLMLKLELKVENVANDMLLPQRVVDLTDRALPIFT